MKKGSEKRGKRKLKVGVVVKKSGDKTVVVEVMRQVKHKMYGKTVVKRKKFMTHNEDNKAKVGDKVAIEETAPVSHRKRWKVLNIEK